MCGGDGVVVWPDVSGDFDADFDVGFGDGAQDAGNFAHDGDAGAVDGFHFGGVDEFEVGFDEEVHGRHEGFGPDAV